MNKYHKILVGIDFSRACRAAVRTAGRFASFFGGQITVLHVMDPLVGTALQQSQGSSDEELLEGMRGRVRDFLDDSGVSTVNVDVRVVLGAPFKMIEAACKVMRADLLVLGTRGTVHESDEIGTLATQCVRKVPADVLLVREHIDHPFRRILACVDFSSTSASAVENARIVGEKDNAELDCLFVFESAVVHSLEHHGHPLNPKMVASPEAFAGWKRNLDTFLQPLMRGEWRIPWRALVEEGAGVRETICDYVEAHDVDLVVLGTRGKSDLLALFMGSTAEKVVSNASCSVLAVKPRPQTCVSKHGRHCDGLDCS